MLAAFVTATLGVTLVGGGLFGRRGVRLVCARCDYPMVTWRGASERCPECGSHWKRPWGARFGERAVRWRWVLTGAALLAASACLMLVVGVWGFRGP